MKNGEVSRWANTAPNPWYREGIFMSHSPSAARRKSTEEVVESPPLTVGDETIDWDGPMAEDTTQAIAKVRMRVRLHAITDEPLPLPE
jgi:hypothetical protein